MKLRITHETLYHYTPIVETAQHVAHLQPPMTPCQSCQQHHLATEPNATQVSSNIDAFGNHRVYWSLPSPHNSLKVTAQSELETFLIGEKRLDALAKQVLHLSWENAVLAYRYRADIASDQATEFAYTSHHAPIDTAFAIYAQSSFPPGRNLIDATRHLMQRIHTDFKYESFSTDISTPALKVLEDKKGVCQDFAHVMLACLRSLGLAARYVSGYLLTEPPPGQPRLIGSDASHAWISLRIPKMNPVEGTESWYDFDPTNNRDGWCSPGTDYVRLAVGRDFADVSPLRGVLQGGTHHTLAVSVTVEPL
ncbi:transglutaminase family protein [Limnohabitans sp. Rim11]|jgi:transglutaminase-like putative cysteine protease|uniref:transglutaminase family protein n=1 Tax=Limnohabitans sp. Rim11 TaxID=1100719 RepID=UPI000AF0CD1A|nr:transglutaminase family protein [Limnohabitans sp. Rim11]